MKKKLAIVAVVLAALVILYPGVVWLMGRLAEQRVQKSLAQLSQQLPYLTVTEQHYHRGWYRSEQDLTLQLALSKLLPLPMRQGRESPVTVRVHNVIHHGPVCGLTCFGFARIDSTYVPSSDTAPLISRLYGSSSPLSVTTHLGFLGGKYVRISTPPIKDVALPKDSHLSWGGAVIEVRSSRNDDHRTVSASMPGVAIGDSEGKRLELTRIAFDSSSERAFGALYSTQAKLTADQLSYRVPGPTSFSAQTLRVDIQTPTREGYMDLIEQIGTGPAHFAGTQFTATHLDFSIRHAQLQALAALQDRQRDFNQTRGLSLRPDTSAMFAAIREPLQQLLLARPELRFDRMAIVTTHGQILIHGSVQAPELTTADFAPASYPRSLWQKIDARVDMTADDQALADIPALAMTVRQQLPALEQRGLVTHDNGHWHTTILFAAGRITVNGKPMAAPLLGGGAPPPAAQ
jgi:uncharacterized protein YdgA (DUF945 family)